MQQQQQQQQQVSGVIASGSHTSTPMPTAQSNTAVGTPPTSAVAAAGGASTPIRISSASKHSGGGDSLLPPATPGGNLASSATSSSHSVPGTPQQQPQSSSVPTASGSHLQLQTPSALSMNASNQSLGMSSVGAGSSSFSGINITPPNSAGIRQSTVFDFKFKRRPSQKVLLSKLPSTDSLSNSPAPSSPGIANWASDNRDGHLADKSSADAAKLNRKESYKAQRKNYRREKKRVASELMNSLQDPAVIVLADWLKVRGTLKSWTKLWCVLKPGLLLIYKSQKTKSSHWVGTVMLTSCQVIERPSKKDGFCFKLFHPLEQSIWAPRGPDKETIGAVVQPLPTAYLIFRAPSQAAGKCWMDALELSLRCSALLLRSNSSATAANNYAGEPLPVSHETQWSEADYEKHFNEHDLDADSQNEAANAAMSGLETDTESDPPAEEEAAEPEPVEQPICETNYVPLTEEEFGAQGEQVEELAEENKSLMWCIVKQVRPGMDLSKVVLPTFILEPRSFLDKLSDSYYHADMLSRAVLEEDAFVRMKYIVQWYLSGFYKKPKGLKKPYNPILGEMFRCYWQHPNGSRTYYIAEQVSHHPPVSAFYVTNREDGFSITCSILAKSKFYGNSTSAVLEGIATMTLLPRGESYTLTTPYAHCKGILMGTLSMELGGKINIECENTGYKTELEFKLKPFLGGADATNVVTGKIKLGKDTLATIQGHWDKECRIKDMRTGDETLLFKADADMRAKRLKRYMVPMEQQEPTESQRMWHLVSEAIAREDQVAATEEKTVLEEAQRAAAKQRAETETKHMPELFELNSQEQWVYKYADLRPWNPRQDIRQYECNFKVLTESRSKASGAPLSNALPKASKAKNKSLVLAPRDTNSDSSQSPQGAVKRGISSNSLKHLAMAVEQVNLALEHQARQLTDIRSRLERMQYAPPIRSTSMLMVDGALSQTTVIKSVLFAIIGLACSLILRWLFK
ncbi:oxysterol-binding protein-related protein 8 isoform X1 [Drosophila busckii]|uniref:oxysterol-binding protein-related protein 8 isoform X1 n=1 Tax=Drosophila busckii TaxID=30019 RepID=UPI00083F179C|nr:oxysterol-binding protein-related protein 8 isoform X1 [Drosophila busckii]